MRQFIYIVLLFIVPVIASAQSEKQKILIDEYLENCGNKLYYHAPEWQECLDAMLEKDSTVAYFWQQKAMPYFKARKYEAGMVFQDKAVAYDINQLPYRAFIKCIFAKTYGDAIADFEKSLKLYGNSYEMDHTYNFYIAVSYLQLNEFEMAEHIFERELKNTINANGVDNAHHLDLFYYGIAKFEQKKWSEAITIFDRALKLYPQFSDVKFYKSRCLARLDKKEEALKVYDEARADFKLGYTINEDNAVYELYPYQITRYRE
ncbi:tetratricopeptide repeat protein [Flavobacterium hauense]